MNPAPTIFYSYSHRDEALRDQLNTALTMLRRTGCIREWHDRKIEAGNEWKTEIDRHLEEASIILLLVSPDFLASDYCYEIEMKRALERHRRGEARVIPVILRPTDWENAPFAHLQALPRDGRPVTSWPDRDEVLKNIAQGIREVVRTLNDQGK